MCLSFDTAPFMFWGCFLDLIGSIRKTGCFQFVSFCAEKNIFRHGLHGFHGFSVMIT